MNKNRRSRRASSRLHGLRVQTTTGQTIAVEEDEEDWRTEAYASYEPSDTESAYDYNYTLTPSEPDTQFSNQQEQRSRPEFEAVWVR